MPRDRMQHIVTLPHGKSCSAYATNLIASTLKIIVCWPYFQLQKLWNEKHVFFAFLVYICTQKFWNPLLVICCTKNYVYTTVDGKYRHGKPLTRPILLIEFSCHTACHGMQKPRLSCTTLMSTLFSSFAARQGRILLHFAKWHSVDAPQYPSFHWFHFAEYPIYVIGF